MSSKDIVYVQASDGMPLMPTSRKGKVKWLLRLKQAKVICLEPFTIRLLYDSKKYIQELPEGCIAGDVVPERPKKSSKNTDVPQWMIDKGFTDWKSWRNRNKRYSKSNPPPTQKKKKGKKKS